VSPINERSSVLLLLLSAISRFFLTGNKYTLNSYLFDKVKADAGYWVLGTGYWVLGLNARNHALRSKYLTGT